MTERFDLPAPNAPNFNERVREVLSTYLGYRGNKLNRGLTVGDLSEAGLIALRAGFLTGSGGIKPVAGAGTAVTDAYEIDLTPPPTPSGFTASAAISNLIIECAAPTYTQGHGHARAVVYGATWTSGALPTFANAVKITEFSGTVFAHPTNPATTWHLWIKWQTVDGVLSTSPAGGANGLVVTTGQDVSRMVAAMTGAGNPFTVLTTSTVIDGVTFPAGTYSTQAFVRDAQITNAKIGNAAIDDAKIANLSASKLTAGSIAVGQHIQSASYVAGTSGWRINGDGTAELANATVRGAVFASSGFIGGITVSGNSVRAGQTAYNTGQGFFLGSTGAFSLGNSAGNRLTWDGTNLNVVSPGLTLNNGAATFSGALSAATGTFSGALSAATGTFAGSLSAATGTFAGQLSAATGSFSGALSAASGTFSGALTASAVNAVNTINIAGDAVTVPASAAGTSSAAVTISVLAGRPVYIHGLAAGFSGGGFYLGVVNLGLSVSGVVTFNTQQNAPLFQQETNPGSEPTIYVTSAPQLAISTVVTPVTSGAVTVIVTASAGMGIHQPQGVTLFVLQTKR